MQKVISKRRIIVTTIFLITLLAVLYGRFRKKEKDNIYPDIFNFNVAECEIDLDKLSDLEGDIFWQEHREYIKCQDFDYKDTTELGNFFSACCRKI